MIKTDRKYHLQLTRVFAVGLFAAFIAAICLIGCGCSASSEQGKLLDSADTKLVALTFDDGPSPYTGTLLDGLAERNAYATFFMTGKNGDGGIAGIENGHRDLLVRMWEEGHQLANHSYSHLRLDSLSSEEIEAEISQVEKLVFEACGGSFSCFVRTPGGHVNNNIRTNVSSPIVGWTLDTHDWETRDADSVYRSIVDSAENGDIILLHDLYETSIDGALRAIDELQSKGYEFVTVAELVRRLGSESVNSLDNSVSSKNMVLDPYSAPELHVVEIDAGDIAVTCENVSGLRFYYTLDGSYPNLSSSELIDGIVVEPTDKLTVIGIDSWGTRTPVTVS